jgi:carbon monoxide dehydrogenase subunit G
MSVVEVSAEIDASPEEVWNVIADPRNLPLWDRHIVAVEGIPESGLQEGSEYSSQVRFMGASATARSRVIELRPPTYAKVKVSGIVDATVESWLEGIDGGRTRLRHRVDYRFKGGPIGELVATAIKMLGAGALLRRGIQAQKRQAEPGA